MAGIREERREQIIKAAMTVFGKTGYHRSKMGEIAQEAEIGKSTVYEYFDSKKDLFEEMIRFIAKDYYEDVKEALDRGNSSREKLLSFAKDHGSFIKSHMELAENTMSDSASVSLEIKKEMLGWKMKIFQLVEDVLQEGIKSGELRAGLDTGSATSVILGSINEGYAVQCVIGGKKPEDVDLEPVIDLIFTGMKASEQITSNNEQ